MTMALLTSTASINSTGIGFLYAGFPATSGCEVYEGPVFDVGDHGGVDTRRMKRVHHEYCFAPLI